MPLPLLDLPEDVVRIITGMVSDQAVRTVPLPPPPRRPPRAEAAFNGTKWVVRDPDCVCLQDVWCESCYGDYDLFD